MKYVTLIEKEIFQVLTPPSSQEVMLYRLQRDLIRLKAALEEHTPPSIEDIGDLVNQKNLIADTKFNFIANKTQFIESLSKLLAKSVPLPNEDYDYAIQEVTNLIVLIQTSYIPTEKKIKDYFFKTLNWRIQQAILCGEYYDLEIQSKLKAIDSPLYLFNPNTAFRHLSEEEINKIESIIRFGFQNYISQFQILSEFVKENTEKLRLGKSAMENNVSRFQNYEIKNQVKQLLKQYSEDDDELLILEINLYLAYTDESLECDDMVLSRLKHLIEFLRSYTRNAKSSLIIKVLIDKAEFLKYKIQLRNYRAALKQELTQDTIPLPTLHQNNVFQNFQIQIENHYLSCKHDFPNLKHLLEEMESKNVSEYKLEAFHHLNKYLKGDNVDLKKRIFEIDEVLRILKAAQNKTTVSLELVSLRTMEQLISNNRLSADFLIEERRDFKESIACFIKEFKGELNSNEKGFIESKIAEIETLQAKNSLPNYYCYIIFIEFLDQLTNRLIKNPELLISEELFEEFHDKESLLTIKIDETIKKLKGYYKAALENLKSRFAIVGTHRIKPLYLMLSECHSEYNFNDTISPNGKITENLDQAEQQPQDITDSMSLFINSSYILPNDFKKITAQIEKWEMFLTPQLNHLKDALDIAVGKHTIGSNINDFDKKVKESEFKAVQILAMFVSIAIFALGSVTIFNGKSGIESLGIICGLCACFISFNLFFYLITIFQLSSPKRRKLLINRFYFFLLIPVFFGTASFLILNSNNLSLPDKIRNENDSLSVKYNTRFDSLSSSLSRFKIITDTLAVKLDTVVSDIQNEKRINQINIRRINTLTKNGNTDSTKVSPITTIQGAK